MLRILGLKDKLIRAAIAGSLALPLLGPSAKASPALVVDAATGDVLFQHDATRPWYPASLTKLMTVYVALSAVRDHKIALDTPLVVSPRAAAMPPSKMGFAPGTEVTLDNALKMLMVRSANDIAITVAEGIAGSVEAFADDMNEAAARLNLHESHFVNPNGLPDPGHYSSARDMALIARALYTSFPEQAGLFDLGALSLDGSIIPNHNNMLGRYPGADGMKTGFTCPAGFNIVVSAFRGGRRLVAVILGAPTVATRTAKAAVLLDRAFQGIDRPLGTTLIALPGSPGAAPPDLRAQVCKARPRNAMIAQFKADAAQLAVPLQPAQPAGPGAPQPYEMALGETVSPNFEPVPVHIGPEPGYTGPVAQARPPHSAIGTDPGPGAAIAYAPPQAPASLTAASPLKPDASALPLRGRSPSKKAARNHEGAKKAVAKAEAETDKKETPKAPAAKPGVKAKAAPAAKAKVAALAKSKTAAKSEPAPPARPKTGADTKSGGAP